ncbi:DUF5958 family protein [Hymenobacter jeollabukensis]
MLNRIAQDQLPLSAGLTWFDALTDEEQRAAMNELHLYVHQSHPTPTMVQQAVATAPIKRGATPLALLRAFPFHIALPKIISLRADERRNAFAALLTLFRIADTQRRITSCQDGCSHDWHHLPPCRKPRGPAKGIITCAIILSLHYQRYLTTKHISARAKSDRRCTFGL